MKIQLHKPHNGVSPRALGAFHVIHCWQSMGLAFAKSELSEFSTKLQTRLIISPKMASTGGGWTHCWNQPQPKSQFIQRWRGCRKIDYCNQEFPEEHLKKKHKRHWRFLPRLLLIETHDDHNRCVFQKVVPIVFGVSRFRRRGPTYLQLTVLSWRSDKVEVTCIKPQCNFNYAGASK